MYYRYMLIMGIFMCGLSFAFCDEVKELKTPTVTEVIKQINTKPDSVDNAAITAILDEVSKEIVIGISNEIELLQCLESYDISKNNDFANTTRLLEILENKYKNAPNEMMQLLLHEITLYREITPNHDKLVHIASHMTELGNKIKNMQAVSLLTQLVALGETYRVLSRGDRDGEMYKKSRETFAQVLNFPIFSAEYEPSYGRLKELYTQAAISTVEMTEPHKLRELRIYPFAIETVERIFPDKAKNLNRQFSGTGTTTATAERWLVNAIQDTDEESDINEHLRAVLEYLRKN